MNILYLAHRIPYPPNKGDKLRSFRQLEYLSRRHCVWCVCFVDDPRDFAYADRLAGLCVDVRLVPLRPILAAVRGLWGLVRGQTLTESYFAHPAMNHALDQWSRTVAFDVVVAFSSSMAPYAMGVPARRRVLDLCDLDSEKWKAYANFSAAPRRWLYAVESDRLARRECGWINDFDAAMVASASEAAPFRAMPDMRQPYVVTNGVEIPKGSGTESTIESHPPMVGFIGVMDYFPNVDGVCWFVSECWPRIRKQCPNAVFRIVGRSPVRRVRRLAKIRGVEVAGEVPDIGPQIRRFDVSVAPLRIARGIQNKVLEAMAWGKPVVLTRAAADGLAGRNGRDFLVADTSPAMADHVIRLLGDATERTTMGLSAREFVERHHQWDDALRIFEGIVTGGPSSASHSARVAVPLVADQTPTGLAATSIPAVS